MDPFDNNDAWPITLSWNDENDVMEPTPLAPPERLQIVSSYPLWLTPSSGGVGQQHQAALTDLFSSFRDDNVEPTLDDILVPPFEQEREDAFSTSIPDINLAGFSADMSLPGMNQEPDATTGILSGSKTREASSKSSSSSTTCTTPTTTWRTRFQELCAFVQAHGHAAVPSHYPPNVKLSHWVKRQRAAAKNNGLSAERKTMLDQVGFVWDVQSKLWDFRLEQLKEFAMQYGHCRVPANQTKYRELAVWVKCQRRQYKLREQGRSNHLTQSRIQRLEAIGFSWAPSKEKER